MQERTPPPAQDIPQSGEPMTGFGRSTRP
jgi:hypothetical protein